MTSYSVKIDRIACDGHGSCAEVLPDQIILDEWGFPIVHGGAVPQDQLRDARLAADLCPRLALKLMPMTPGRQS